MPPNVTASDSAHAQRVQKAAHRQEEHIRHAVLEAGSYECRDGQQDSEHFIGNGTRGKPDHTARQTRILHIMPLKKSVTQSGDTLPAATLTIASPTAPPFIPATPAMKTRNTAASAPIKLPTHTTVQFLSVSAPAYFPSCFRADQKRVAGEQLGATAQHEHESQTEAYAPNQALHRERHGRVAQEHAEIHGPECNERAGEHCGNKAFRKGHGRFRLAERLGFLRRLGRRQSIRFEGFYLVLRQSHAISLSSSHTASRRDAPERSIIAHSTALA